MALDVNALRSKAGSAVKSFSPQQLVVIGLLGVVCLFAVLWFVRWISAPSYSVLYSGLDEKDTAAVVQELESQGVPYRLEGGGTTILVPEAQLYRTRLDLSSSGVVSGGAEGWSIMDGQSFTASEFSQRIDYQRALSGELTKTIMAMDGIDSAKINLAIPEETLFTEEEKPVTASVLIDPRGQLDDEQVQAIVSLVSSAVPSLSPKNVTVSDTSGRVLSSPGGAGQSAALQRLELTRQFEQSKAVAAEAMLANVLGPGRAVVQVAAELAFDETTRKSVDYDPEQVVDLSQSSEREVYEGNGSEAQGELGVDPENPAAVDPSGAGAYENTKDQIQRGVDTVEETVKLAVGDTERLSVSVLLDQSAENVPDPNQVTQLVANAIGFDQARGDTIVVQALPFDETVADAADAAVAEATTAQSTDQTMGYVRTAVSALVLLLVLFFLRKGLKGPKVKKDKKKKGDVEEIDLSEGELAGALVAGGAAGALGAAADSRALVPVGALTSGSPNDVLSLIDSQPDEVAALLRSWVADRRS